MKINSDLTQKINSLTEDKKSVLTFLLEDIEDGKPQTTIEDRLQNEIREVILEGEQN